MHRSVASALYRGIDLVTMQRILSRLEVLKDSEFWPASRLKQMQREKLRELLRHAGTRIPHYRRAFATAGVDLVKGPPEGILGNLPVVAKAQLIENTASFLDPAPAERYIWDVTSGSTGAPMRIRRCLSANGWARANELRGLLRYGLAVGDKQARVWGVPIGDAERRRQAIRDFLLNRKRYSSFDLDAGTILANLDRMSRHRPAYLYGYPSAIHYLARYCLSHGQEVLGDWRPKLVVTTAEMLFPDQAEDIRTAFDCPVADEYGASELTVIAFTCPQGSLHVNDESVIVEYEPTDLNVDGERAFRLILTDLNNFSMPLIRYRIGDLGRPKGECSCGRRLQVMELLGGREVDVLRTPSGRSVHGSIFSYLGKSILIAGGVARFRAVQSQLDRVEIEIEKGKNFSAECLAAMRAELRALAGSDIEVVFNEVAEVVPEPSGKLRYFCSRLNQRVASTVPEHDG